jgi:hypothetical protein
MRLPSSRRSAIALAALLGAGATATGGSAAGRNAISGARSPAHGRDSALSGKEAAAADHPGGVSISPGIFEHLATRGSLGVVQVSNTTRGSMSVRVALRPWLQARSGEVSPNRRATLNAVGLAPSSFTLGAGATQAIRVSLSHTPTQRSLYGGLEMIALPSGRVKQGVSVAYRVVSSMRLDPPKGEQRFHATAGGLVEQGAIGHGTLLLPVRNTGNTIAPIGGSALISGFGHSLRSTAREKAIVPGQTVNVPLAELPRSLPRGLYTVSVRLSEGGHGIGTLTRTIRLR